VLVLVVLAVPEGELLLAVDRGIHGVQVERQVARRSLEGSDELVEDHVAKPLKGLDAVAVLKAREWAETPGQGYPGSGRRQT
jgi:hypothetical protein